ncbi:MAG TPA: DUF1800 family protein [Acetobacteraceae bacterium]|jgi:uncharacterized protein (DUF1800 family)|nr:DUF1800 family protein [Acetobacteraceae bacterium]
MALDPRGAAVALHRFGFGPRPGTIAAVASDPQGALIAELDRANAGKVPDAGLLSSGAANRIAFEFNAARLAQRRVEARRQEAAKLVADNAAMQNSAIANAGTPKPDEAKPPVATPSAPEPETPMRENFFREAKVHYDAAITADIGFVERLVWFWSNHFCVNADVTVMAGAYEREAIRPHVLGKFADLLLAAEGHPAMLIYLDNASSIGPDSVAGINRNRGINENLGREILELHTLGVRSGYNQDDVVSLAKAITGWTIYATADNPDHGGEFLYHPRLHEPGPETVLGKAYRDTGVEQGRAVLADLARNPATARHVATKLARHFIADEPSPALIETLTKTFLATDGDLWQVSKALVAAPESWSPDQAKMKHPSEWMVASIRAAGFNNGDVRRMVPALNRLGEPLWRPPAPKGFGDENADWLDGLAHRLDTANAIAQNYGERLDPQAMLETSLGPIASTETRSAVTRAETRQQALTLLLMAPEFQRR